MDLEHATYVRRVFLDASALVRYLLHADGKAAELGGAEIATYIERAERLPYTNEPCLTECLTVLKRKFQKKVISWDGYQMRVYLLKSIVDREGMKVSEFNFWERGVSDKALALSKKHMIDFLDAVQIVDIQNGPYSSFVGQSAPLLITTDKDLRNAARAEGVPVWYPIDEMFPD